MSIIRSKGLPHLPVTNGKSRHNGLQKTRSSSSPGLSPLAKGRINARDLGGNGFHRAPLIDGEIKMPIGNGSNRLQGNGNGHRNHLNIVILGLSITSSWGNGHATTYRGLVRELCAQGHRVLFLERDQPWYADNRDLPKPPFGRTALYSTVQQLKDRFASAIRNADLVIVGSYVQEGKIIGDWVTRIAHGVTAFYDIDTPVTMARLREGELDYLSADLIERYQMYLSFTGGPLLHFIEKHYGSPMARPLYCSVDPELYYPEQRPIKWDVGYMGTYSEDRQPALDELMLEAARRCPHCRFVVAGPQYPRDIRWPVNVKRFTHLPPAKHRAFYNSQKFTLNVTRADMVEAGYSPSVRLFEAAACGIPIITDYWEGLEEFFEPGSEILVARCCEETLRYLRGIDEEQRQRIGQGARHRVLRNHTARHRAIELEDYALELLKPAGLTEATPA
jgi:spore maturation protein CgeB